MSTHRYVALFLGFAALLLLDCKGNGTGPRVRPPPWVTAAKVEARDVSVEIRAAVDLRPLAQADVGSKTLGYLDAVLVDRGDYVHKGQLLALVRPSDLPDQLNAARGTLAQAQAAAALAQANKARAEQLAPSGVVSEQDLQQSTTALATAQASLNAARANVAALAVRLGETRIEAPLDGYVSQRRLDPGALVGPSAGTGAILTLQRSDTLRVFIPVNEAESEHLQVGQEARVELDAFPKDSPHRVSSGKVVRISPGFDPLTRTLDAEVHLKNTGKLRPGMYGRGTIVVATHPKAVVVPASAVQISNGAYYLFRFHPDDSGRSAPGKSMPGKVERVRLEVGVDGGDWLEVLPDESGHPAVQAGDVIVTAGTDVLSDGAAVAAHLDFDPFTGPRVIDANPARN